MADAHPDYSRLAEVVGGLGLHQHLCVIYDTQEEQFAAALPYLRTGLERAEKCLYFGDENTAAAVLHALRKIGIDVDQYLRSGALTITHKRETDLQQGRFDPDWWTAFLNQAAAEASAAKFSVLRILGDLSWALRGSNSRDKLIEYESRINHFVRDHDARVICQYNRNCNAPELILAVIRTHPLVVYGGIVCKNPYYVPPDEFLKPNQASQEVERLLHNILAWERAEQALRRSEGSLRLVIDTVPALIHTGLPDGYLDFFNQRWLDYVGLSLEDLLGWKWTAAIHPEDVAAMVEKWRAALRTGEPYEHEARVRRADGEYRWMVHREAPLRDERGIIVKWYASSIDIEDRKRAEMQWRTLIDAIPQQIWSGPPDGTNDYVNARWRSDMGLELEDLRGDGWQTMLHPEDRDRVLKAWHESVLNGTPYEQEERHRRADGTFRWFLNRGVPLRDAEGRIVRWYGTNTDIEDRKQADEELRQAEDRIRAILEFSPNWIFLKDAEGRYLLVNREVERVFRISQEQIKGKTDSEIFPSERAAEYRANDLKVIREGLTMEFEEIADLEDGPHTSIVHKFPLFDTHGNIYATGGVATDITERKRAEEALRASEERWRAVFENSAVGIALTDPQGKYLCSNRAYQEMVGYTDEELRALSYLDITYEEDREINRGLSVELQEGKRRGFQLEKRYRRKDGNLIWVRLTASQAHGADGKFQFGMGIVEDITERKLTEGLLRDSEERFRATFENAGIAMALVDVEGRPIKCNPALERMLGYSGEELSRMAFTEFTHPDDRELDWGLYGELTAGKRDKYDIEKRYLKKDGSVVWGLLTVSLLKGRLGRPAYAVGMVQEITERKRAEEALRASEERWRSVFENSAIGVALTDLNGLFLASNPVYQKMVGYHEAELLALSFLDITQEEYRKPNWKLIVELLEGKRQQFQIEKQYRRKDGSLIWVRNSVSLVPGTENMPRFIMALSEDITEHKRAEEALQKSRDQLRALAARLQDVREEERTKVAREIHDELGQALTAIKMDLSSLTRGLPAGRIQQSESILKLVDETIHSVRRISTELRPAILDALGLVAAVEWASEEFEARTGTKCQLDLPQHGVVIDQERATPLFRILQETLTNVARHADATEVHIRLAKENGNLSLEVRDNGKGAGDEGLSAADSLGVLGMRERARLLGGELTIIGSPGKGTTVKVRIPDK